ncbi:MAG TPA: hypothetical protein VJL87_02005 [Bdellovibrionota bacterium]|nr:hypothetical protein [Bdellovibrionota bacterium]
MRKVPLILILLFVSFSRPLAAGVIPFEVSKSILRTSTKNAEDFFHFERKLELERNRATPSDNELFNLIEKLFELLPPSELVQTGRWSFESEWVSPENWEEANERYSRYINWLLCAPLHEPQPVEIFKTYRGLEWNETSREASTDAPFILFDSFETAALEALAQHADLIERLYGPKAKKLLQTLKASPFESEKFVAEELSHLRFNLLYTLDGYQLFLLLSDLALEKGEIFDALTHNRLLQQRTQFCSNSHRCSAYAKNHQQDLEIQFNDLSIREKTIRSLLPMINTTLTASDPLPLFTKATFLPSFTKAESIIQNKTMEHALYMTKKLSARHFYHYLEAVGGQRLILTVDQDKDSSLRKIVLSAKDNETQNIRWVRELGKYYDYTLTIKPTDPLERTLPLHPFLFLRNEWAITIMYQPQPGDVWDKNHFPYAVVVINVVDGRVEKLAITKDLYKLSTQFSDFLPKEEWEEIAKYIRSTHESERKKN